MLIKELESISILGLGLLGGSVGLAINRSFPRIRRAGYSHRQATRQKALAAGVVDAIYPTVAGAVAEAQLIILASPIGVFEKLMRQMMGNLPKDCVVTDVGSTKVLPVSMAKRIFKKKGVFVGSHPMAGSEQQGVEFARADLFDDAHCIITPSEKSPKSAVSLLTQLWQALGMRVCTMSPAAHDRVLARISHLPHVLAMTLMNCSDPQQMLLCGKGFLDTTRIASGPPAIWRDILSANAGLTAAAIKQIIKELSHVQVILEKGDDKAVLKMLSKAQSRRNKLVEQKLKRKELPT
ncbi:MAG: hypothetical protein AMJ79_00485 [Phycisphaerae bacterium SM23_30]|nr:MAG: hypothetical protein AMJ79_00485 [Phycisphaerae bacterium SM23_30]